MSAEGSPALRLAGFAALATFAAAHWVSLVENPPAGRIALALAILTAGGALLVVIGRAGLPRLGTRVLAALAAVSATVLALAAVGLSLTLLWPSAWDELGSNLDRGFTGLAGDVDYPYQGANEWSRLAILAAAPLALGVAAAFAFWPTPERHTGRRRTIALAILVGLYATAIAVHPIGGQLVRGLVLLGLIAIWLWLPRLPRRDVAIATGLVAAAGAIAVPTAGALNASDPWLEYSKWTWSNDAGVTYSWDHSYGPLDWPRDGTTMLAVSSNEAHYWRALVLDRFDGSRWERSEAGNTGLRPLPESLQDAEPPQLGRPEWLQRVDVTIGSLHSDFVIAPGTPVAVDGVGPIAASPDGTTLSRAGPLKEGDRYTVSTYVPDPSAAALRAVPDEYPSALARYTQLDVPASPGNGIAATPAELLPTDTVTVPQGLDTAHATARSALLASPYARTYRYARRLVAGAPTAYDAVVAIQNELRLNYAYSEDPPARDFPLDAFLFQDRIGYCQQFSGAMALMLRMVGIPSRVAAGFAPGSPDTDQEGVFQVEDFDAHSWVEVYFSGIGWITFDPTPAASPAASQTGGLPENPKAVAQQGGETTSIQGAHEPTSARDRHGKGASSQGPHWILPLALALLAALAAAAAAVAVRRARFRRLSPSLAAESQLNEIASGLGRLGWRVREGETLLGLERRLRRAGNSAAGRYLAALRLGRYAAGEAAAATLAGRRALRRELTRVGGPRARLRGLIALPPGGPRLRTRRGLRGSR